MSAVSVCAVRLSGRDVARVGLAGLRARPLRVALSSAGIAIGIATMVAVVGISQSSRADLDAQLSRIGTNLLRAEPGSTLSGDPARLPKESVEMVRRIGPVASASATARLSAGVRRTHLIPARQTGGITVRAARLDLADTVGLTTARGRWLDAASAQYPAVVLGAVAAQRLSAAVGQPVWLGQRWWTVVGVLDPAALAPELDRSALVGWEAATDLLGFDGYPTTLYERSGDDSVEAVRALLARTANPANPQEVEVSRPSDALAAKAATRSAFTGLLLGLGAVGLLVGGLGVANTMVIAVIERRADIGLRRALGATRSQILLQFLVESVLLTALGGATGALAGAGVTTLFATTRGWSVALPVEALGGVVLITLVMGALAGLYPAVRAARLAPAEALGSA